MKRALLSCVSALAALLVPSSGWSWGATGHRIIGQEAVSALPEEVPAFVRSPDAVAQIGELAREPDRSKGAGRIHDHQRDAAHFVDVDDAGRILGGPTLDALPPTRLDYAKALAAVGTDEIKAGYLPYALIDG